MASILELRRRLGVVLLLVLGVTAIYARTGTFEFTTYDDPDYVTQNEVVGRGLTLDGLTWALTSSHASNWHPLTWISHMVDVELFGMSAGGHHATSVLLHAASAALLFLLLLQLTGATWRSAIVAALFAFHPLRVESVAWVAERKDVLSALFGLAALFAYTFYAQGVSGAVRLRQGRPGRPGGQGRQGRRSAWYGASLVLLVFALMSKPMMVTLPFVFLLVDSWPLRRPGGARLVLEKLPFFAMSAACAAITVAVQRGGGAMQAADTISLVPRLINALVSYAWYLWKTVVPVPLAPLYVHPALPGGTPWEVWQIAIASLVLLVISALVFRHRERGYPVVGWLWYLGMLVPAIGIVQVGGQAAADRYTYLPSIGIFLLVVWLAADLISRSFGRTGARVAAIVTLLPLAVLGALSGVQTERWRDSRSLYEHAVRVSPDAALMHNNLALVLSGEGDTEGAERHFWEALRAHPNYPQAAEALADLRAAEGDLAEAEELLTRALLLRGQLREPAARAGEGAGGAARVRVLVKLGDVRAAKGDAPGARSAYDEALRLRPGLEDTEFHIGVGLQEAGRPEEARERLERAFRMASTRADFAYRLGGLVASLGETEAAIRWFEETVRLDPSLAEAENNLGWMLAQSGRASAAVPHLEAAIRLRPEWELPRQNLEWIRANADAGNVSGAESPR